MPGPVLRRWAVTTVLAVLTALLLSPQSVGDAAGSDRANSAVASVGAFQDDAAGAVSRQARHDPELRSLPLVPLPTSGRKPVQLPATDDAAPDLSQTAVSLDRRHSGRSPPVCSHF